MYRYNSFLKDEGSTSLIRVHNKEYRIKKEIFTYEELLKCMSYFKELREVETLEEYTLQSKIVRFLMQIGVLNYSEVTYPDAKILRYLIKNYIDFDQMMISLANSDIEIKVIGHESEQLTKLLENRIQMYFGDFSSNKVTRKTQIIVVDQRNDLDKIEEAIANIEADNYIVMAFNANKESWIYSTKIKSEVIQMLDNVAINAAVNECLVGHRIYETNPRIGEKEYNSDYDVVEMFDHVNHASRREYIKNYDFLFESEVKTVEELYGSESYKISDSIDDAKDLLDFICKTKLNNHGKIYFADLSTKMSYEYGFFVAKIVVSGMLPMTFGYANQRINRERIKNAIQNSKYSDRCLCKGDEIDDRAHPFP